MRAGLILLTLAYVFSQFFRSFLAVLAEILKQDIGATPEDLSYATSAWFLAFAVMQIPVGAALDRVGPRLTTAVLFLIGGGGGALLFAAATSPVHVILAMLLIGIGCSPVLMASFYIFARTYPPAMFASLGAMVIGVGSFGNLAGSAPLAMMVDAIGWRASLVALGGAAAINAIAIYFAVKDPERIVTEQRGSVLDILKIPALWLIFPLVFFSYAPTAGLRGLWIGPYLTDAFGATKAQVGTASMLMAIAMIAGTFAYGPLDRWLGTRKWVVFIGGAVTMAGFTGLTLFPTSSMTLAIALCVMIGAFGMMFPVIMAHGRSFIPAHLAGRGVTLLNLFGIGGVGVFQFVTGRLFRATGGSAAPDAGAYVAVFGCFALILLLGLIPYLFSRDRLD